MRCLLSSISISLKMKPELENIVLKLAAESMTMRILPFAVDNLEGNILCWKRKKYYIKSRLIKLSKKLLE